MLALNVALGVAQFAFALPRSLGDYFFGPKMVRAEVLVMTNGVVHDYHLDQGRVKAVAPVAGTLTLVERDGTVVPVPVAPNAKIQVNGSPATLSAIKRKMTAITVRDGDNPAETVRAFRGNKR